MAFFVLVLFPCAGALAAVIAAAAAGVEVVGLATTTAAAGVEVVGLATTTAAGVEGVGVATAAAKYWPCANDGMAAAEFDA